MKVEESEIMIQWDPLIWWGKLFSRDATVNNWPFELLVRFTRLIVTFWNIFMKYMIILVNPEVSKYGSKNPAR